MSLRLKTLLTFAIAFSILYGVIVLVAELFIEREFLAIEMTSMDRIATRFAADLDREMRPILSATGDWAPWDETHAFASGRDPSFVDRNLSAFDLVNLQLDFMAIWSGAGELLAFEAIEPPVGPPTLAIDRIADALQQNNVVQIMESDQVISGAINVGGELVLIVARPITDTARTAAPTGTLVAGRVIAASMITQLEQLSGYQVELEVLPDRRETSEQAKVGLRRIAPFSAVVSVADDRQLKAVVPIANIDGSIVAEAILTSLRPLRPQVERTIAIIKVVLAASGAILLFILWFILDTGLVHPIRQLSSQFEAASKTREIPQKLEVRGGGEIAALARRIQSLLRMVRETEASYRAVVEDQTEFIFRYTPNGRIVFANGAYARYLEVQVGRLYGRDAFEQIDADDLPHVREKLAELSTANQVVSQEHRIQKTNGSLAWLRRTDRAIFDDNGVACEYQCVAADITATIQARQKLIDSERRFRRLFETATDGILIAREDSRIVADVNPRFCQIFGVAKHESIGRILDSLPPFQHPSIRGRTGDVLTTQSLRDGAELSLRGTDGQTVAVELFAVTFESGGEQFLKFNLRDISRRRRAENELRKLSGHLIRLQDGERRRIARELHDSTAQNLSAIEMALNRLERLMPRNADRDQLDCLRQIRALTATSSKEIRTLSYLLHPPLLDEAGLVFALRWYVDGFMTRTEMVVHLKIRDDIGRLSPEIETTLFRIVQEALGNILRHSGSRRAWIDVESKDLKVSMKIRDEGRGIRKEILEAMIDRGAMLGVGIAGMRERVRHLDGQLFIESDTKGTIIKVEIPLAQPDET